MTDCHDVEGTHYFGLASTTVSGEPCQKWTQQQPHKHEFTAEQFYETSLVSQQIVIIQLPTCDLI